MQYLISKEAEKDLEGIWFYTFENWSLNQADYYVNLIFNDIEFIANNPKSGKITVKLEKGIFGQK